MSKNNNKRQRNKYITDSRIYRLNCKFNIPYDDECSALYHNSANNWRKGKNYKKRKITYYQRRLYRNWKYNRIKQYK